MHQPQDGRWRQPPYPYAPQFRPPRRRRSRIWIAYLAAGVFAVTATVFALAPRSADVGQIDSDPAAAFDGASAIDLAYTYIAPDGSETNGWFSVTDDGYAVGSVEDRLGGSAELHVTPESSAVLGDQDWWARRSPAQAGELEGAWVRPDEGAAFPLDVSDDLTPEAVADLIRTVDAEGTEVDTPAAGTITTTWQDWTLVRTVTVPTEVLSLAGPLDSDLIGRPAATSGSYETETAEWAGGEDVTVTPVLAGAPGWMQFVPGPAGPQTGELVRSTAQETNSGEATAGSEEAEPPPAQADIEPVWPAFQATINATDCWSSTCSWSATVENVGTGPGEALVTASVTPGMSPVNQDLGTIQPGSSASTTTMSFGNPAPTPAPGQTTEITVAYEVIVYSPQLGGGDQGKYMDLLDKLGGRTKQPALDRILGKVAPVLASGLVDTLSQMIDSGIAPDAALDAADAATEAAPAEGEYADLPALNRLAQAGDRFQGWDAINDALSSGDIDTVLDYQAGIQAAVEALAAPAEPSVALLPAPGPTPGRTDTLVITESPDALECTQVTRLAEGDLPSEAASAVERLNDPTGPAADTLDQCTAGIRVVTAPTAPAPLSPITTVQQLQETLPGSTACQGGGRFDGLSITTGNRTDAWPASVLCSTAREIGEEELEMLNGLGLPEDLVASLKNEGIVTVDADGRITDVKRRKEDPCESRYFAGPTSELAEGSEPWRRGGSVASGSAAYLCDQPRKGQETSGQKPWDFPRADAHEILRESDAHGTREWPFAACHLVGNQLGGYVTMDNLVTCHHPTTNNRDMEPFESGIAARISKDVHMLYMAVPYYNGAPINGGHNPLGGIRVTVLVWVSGTMQPPIDRCFVNSWSGGWLPGTAC